MSGNFLIYKTEDDLIEVNVRFDMNSETVWLTQNQMADLFTTTKQNISDHIKIIFEEGELDEKATVKDFLTVQQEGSRTVSRQLRHYNLDVIISVGYRVKSMLQVLITILARMFQLIFSKKSRIRFIMPSTEKQLLKSFITEQTQKRSTWD